MNFKIKISFLLILGLAICGIYTTKAQIDSTITDSKILVKPNQKKDHSVLKASVFSAVVPGLGQIYNRKIWKVPFVYGAFAFTIYYADHYNSKYKEFIDVYKNDPSDYNQQGIDFYRRYRDLFIIYTGLVYVLNIVDASVDANFYKFDVGDDLSLQVQPAFLQTGIAQTGVGLRCSFTFK